MVITKFLQCMQKHQYIGDLEIVDDHRSGKVVVDLVGRINKCGVISPRFDVALPGIEQMASDLLPSRQFGHLVLSTPYGIMTHEEARRKHTGGKIVGFFFLAFWWSLRLNCPSLSHQCWWTKQRCCVHRMTAN